MSLLNYFGKKEENKKVTKKRNATEMGKEEPTENNEQKDENGPPAKRRKIEKVNTDEKEESVDCEQSTTLSYSNCETLLHESWKSRLEPEFTKPYFQQLKQNLNKEEKSKVEIFPPVNEVFAAFEYCPFDNLKAVIIGQDPYHDDGQAEGLCFSVKKGIKIPSSLRNMYKEAENDDELETKFKKPNHGSLIEWAKQGVLLLNTVLTVQAHKANSHKKFGWQQFTDSVIKLISKEHDGCVFICWGKQAQKKSSMIDKKKHKIIESAHPSGLSASRGFFGSKPYSKTNKLLKEIGKTPIDWRISIDPNLPK